MAHSKKCHYEERSDAVISYKNCGIAKALRASQ